MTRPSTSTQVLERLGSLSVDYLDRIENLSVGYLSRLEDLDRLVEQLTLQLAEARRQIAELEEANAFLEAKQKEIVERMEAGLEEWARKESARRKFALHRDPAHSPPPRSRR